MTSHYEYQKNLKALWEFALERYQKGDRNPQGYFDRSQRDFMDDMGLRAMDIYDYVEDFSTYSEPDFETFLMICEARRDYFMVIQQQQPSAKQVDSASLPPKEADVDGIVWLPRLLAKARAKLRGELADDVMYGCGGDRKFFRESNIHPAEFLRHVWASRDSDAKVIGWVKARRSGLA